MNNRKQLTSSKKNATPLRPKKKGNRVLHSALCMGLLLPNFALGGQSVFALSEETVPFEATHTPEQVDTEISQESKTSENESSTQVEPESESPSIHPSNSPQEPEETPLVSETEEKIDPALSEDTQEDPTKNQRAITTGISGNVTWEYDSDTQIFTFTSGGTLGRSPFWNTITTSKSKKIIFQHPVVGPESMTDYFSPMRELESIEGLELLDTSNVRDMSRMFLGARALTSLNLTNFNTSKVTDMYAMFLNTNSLTELDVRSFDTSNVRFMDSMFSGTLLTSLDLSTFNTSKVVSMSGMFSASQNLASLDLSHFDTSKVTTMLRMFTNTLNLATLNISSFDTSNVKDMGSMFFGTNALTDLDLTHFDTSNVTSMRLMFYNTTGLENLDVRSFNTSNVTDMQQLFHGTGLKTVDLSAFDTSNVTNMEYMFFEASNLTSVNLNSFNTSNVKTMTNMFNGATSLTSLDLSSFDMGKVSSPTDMLANTTSLSELKVGEKAVFNTRWGTVQLPEITPTALYTGRWIRSTPQDPLVVYSTSLDFMTQYDGSQPGTYRWEQVPTFDVKEGLLYTGSSWNPSENYVSGQDAYGNPLPFDQLHITGTVDTETPGVYDITYTYGELSKTIKVTVLKNQTHVEANDSTVIEGTDWTPEDNFVSATAQDGESVDFSAITVSGMVDTTVPGSYDVTYSYNGYSTTITITVVQDRSTLVVRDLLLTVGDSWTASDTFVSATDKAGNPVSLDQLLVTGTVDTEIPGVYEVAYTYGQLTEVATINVLPVDVKKATVSFDANGGTTTQAPIEGEVGKTLDLTHVKPATREGYTFLGWFNGTEKMPLDLLLPETGVTYVAKWEKMDPMVPTVPVQPPTPTTPTKPLVPTNPVGPAKPTGPTVSRPGTGHFPQTGEANHTSLLPTLVGFLMIAGVTVMASIRRRMEKN